MGHLAEGLSTLDNVYDAVVVGTGYGGGVAACRLARAGLKVAVLERGLEFRPGDFPEGLLRAGHETQVQLGRRGKWRRIGRAAALFDFRASDDVVALVGCGVGGTSLINANVSLVPDPEVFDNDAWPAPLRGPDEDLGLRDGFRRASEMLRPSVYPEQRLSQPLPKLDALRVGAAAAGHTVESLPINVSFDDIAHSTGRFQRACTGCGDCVTGCNIGAKNSIDQTYLPDAVAHGAKLVTRASVSHLSRNADGDWRVHIVSTGTSGPEIVVDAGIVVLGAGSLGSTEILARSRDAGLWVSDKLTTSISGNGDFLGYAYDGGQRVHGVGQGAEVLANDPVGPTITGGFTVDASTDDGGHTAVLFEEGAFPRPLAKLVPLAMWLQNRKSSRESRRHHGHGLRRILSILQGPYRAAASRTMVFLGMGFDGDRGTLDMPVAANRRPVIAWPDAGQSPEQRATDVAAERLAEQMGATYVRSPVFGKFITVHPLGGCDMGSDGVTGVVNHAGQVFGGSGSQLHDGLYVVDGAVVPVPLGKNPSLTITAIAERALALLLKERGLEASTGPAPLLPEASVGVTFRERMTGHCFAMANGEEAKLDLQLAITFPDLNALDESAATPGQIRGTVHVGLPDLGAMSVDSGTLVLFESDPAVIDQADMRYELRCTGEDGSQYQVSGIKRMHDHPGIDLLRDTTTLTVSISRTEGQKSLLVARGRVSISLTGLAKMVASMRATTAGPEAADRVKAMVRFGWRFGQGLIGTYGKVLRQRAEFQALKEQPPRRELNVPQSTSYWCRTDLEWVTDNPGPEAMLKLERFHGGTKGPVMLAPGFAMAASQFLVDTIEPNLVEQLVAADYDVWLFDYRAGINMPTARSAFTIDDVATVDWPVAVSQVQDITGAADVQIIAHCVGSMSAQMALLSGMTGVRSAVMSQVTVHPQMHWSMSVKAKLRLPRLLGSVGFRTVEPETDLTVGDRLLDLGVRVNPLLRGERCNNPVCRWVFFFFGPTHIHDQIDPHTHRRIAELFGVASLEGLDHIAMCVAKGHVIDNAGRDVYLPNIDRFRVPITFLVGGRNRIFFPSSTRTTLAWLRDNTPRAQFEELYRELYLADYAHLDNFIGRNAPTEVFPKLIAELERFN